MIHNLDNADPAELEKFAQHADQWWDPRGAFRTLHAINPVRVEYIAARTSLEGARVLDVGCGGGLLAEALVRQGAEVTAIDLADRNIGAATRHAQESGLSVDYRVASVEEIATQEAGRYDIVTCLELLEHVPDPARTVAACARCLRPGGTAFFSTINRTPKSFLLAILGAEYLLGLVPRGTHEYARLVRPHELARWCRESGLQLGELTGLHYDPLRHACELGGNVNVNYFARALRPAD